MPDHQAPQMRDIIRLEQSVPASHPSSGAAVQDEHLVLGTLATPIGDLSALDMLEGHFVAVFADKVVSPVFFVRKEGGWGVFSEAGGDGEAAGAGADDEDIVDVFLCCQLLHF